MKRRASIVGITALGGIAGFAALWPVAAVLAQAPTQATATRDLSVTVGKSVLVDSPAIIERIAVANGTLAEAVAVTPREILVNGKAAGETSMIVWQQGGNRLFFDLTIHRNDSHLDGVRRQLAQEMGGGDVTLDLEDDIPFLRGTVADVTTADRAVTIAQTLGKPVNLLRVKVPETDPQILLKVRFIDVDRSTSNQLGISFASGGSVGNTVASVATGQAGVTTGVNGVVTLTNALNVFLFRKDLNIGAAIQALQSKNLVQILAEPNVLAINGHTASFLAGGEFPYPTLQGGGGGVGQVTISFREFGVRINFTPTITPRGTIRLSVTPEVSSLDFANGLTFNGITIPGLDTRRVQTEIELEDAQSFAIGGLLDNRDTESYSKIAGLGDIPFFGKLFHNRTITKNNSELIVLVTPEIVRPIPKDAPLPDLKRPSDFLPPNTSSTSPHTPGPDVTGPIPALTLAPTLPVEQLKGLQAQQAAQNPGGAAPVQFVPVQLMPAQNVPPAAPPAPASAPAPAKP
jgi:pilus assembly protein CpaC